MQKRQNETEFEKVVNSKKKKEIKEKICAAAHEKGIRCEWSEYKKYS